MSAPPENVGERELAFFFQTNEPIPARPLLNFLYEVDRIARTRGHLGPAAVVEITEVRTGTKLVRFTFDRKVALAALAVAVIALGHDLSARIQQPTGRLAESVAEMCLDHGVAECVISTSEGQVRITRDQMPAIARLREKRERVDRIGQAFGDDSDRWVSGLADSAPPAVEKDLLERPAEDLRLGERAGADGRVYTIVGKLQPPSSARAKVPVQNWQFDALSGKTYIARGINADRIRIPATATVVLRAEVGGVEAGFTVLNVKDVFLPEDP